MVLGCIKADKEGPDNILDTPRICAILHAIKTALFKDNQAYRLQEHVINLIK